MANPVPAKSLYTLVGWALGFVVSGTAPTLIAPLGLTAPFFVGGAVAGMLGFSAMYKYAGRKGVSGQRKLVVASISGCLGLGAYFWYRHLMLAEENATPSITVEVAEFALYCVASFLILAALGYVYWQAGPDILARLMRKSPASPSN